MTDSNKHKANFIPLISQEDVEFKVLISPTLPSTPQDCLDLIKLSPNNPTPYIILAKHLLQQNNPTKALQSFEFAYQNSRKNISLIESLISLSSKLGDYQRVITYTSRLIHLYSNLLDRFKQPDCLYRIREIIAFRINLNKKLNLPLLHKKNLEFVLRFGTKDDLIFEELYNTYYKNQDFDNLARLLDAGFSIFEKESFIKLENKNQKIATAIKLSAFTLYPNLAKTVTENCLPFIKSQNNISLNCLLISAYMLTGQSDKITEQFKFLEKLIELSKNNLTKIEEDTFLDMFCLPLKLKTPLLAELLLKIISKSNILNNFNNTLSKINVAKIFLNNLVSGNTSDLFSILKANSEQNSYLENCYYFYAIEKIMEKIPSPNLHTIKYFLSENVPHVYDTIPSTFSVSDAEPNLLNNLNLFNNLFYLDKAHSTVFHKIQKYYNFIFHEDFSNINNSGKLDLSKFKIFLDYLISPILEINKIKLVNGVYMSEVKNSDLNDTERKKLAIYSRCINRLFKDTLFSNSFFCLIEEVQDNPKLFTKYVLSFYFYLDRRNCEGVTIFLLFYKLAFLYSECEVPSLSKKILKRLSESEYRNSIYVYFLLKHLTGYFRYSSEDARYLDAEHPLVLKNIDWYLISYISKYKSFNKGYLESISKISDKYDYNHKFKLCKGISQFCIAQNRNYTNKSEMMLEAVTTLEECKSLLRGEENEGIKKSVDGIYKQFFGEGREMGLVYEKDLFVDNINEIYKEDIPDNNRMRKFQKKI